jgi:hypothetical protein
VNLHNLALAAFAALATSLPATDAQACGEVMFRSGDVMRYRAFTTRHPAAILVYVAENEAASDGDLAFVRGLGRAGHKVTVARGPARLALALGTGSYDLVIGHATLLDGAMPQMSQGARGPTLIPILAHGDRASGVAQRFAHVIAEDADFNSVLRAIEHAMKSRGA